MNGFTVGKNMEYAAIPYGKSQFMIIHNGEQLKICRTELSARNFINTHQKNKSSGKIP